MEFPLRIRHNSPFPLVMCAWKTRSMEEADVFPRLITFPVGFTDRAAGSGLSIRRPPRDHCIHLPPRSRIAAVDWLPRYAYTRPRASGMPVLLPTIWLRLPSRVPRPQLLRRPTTRSPYLVLYVLLQEQRGLLVIKLDPPRRPCTSRLHTSSRT